MRNVLLALLEDEKLLWTSSSRSRWNRLHSEMCQTSSSPSPKKSESGRADDVQVSWFGRSVRRMKEEQTQRLKRGGLEIQPFGDCWIEQVLRRKYIGTTTELKGDM